MANVTIITDGIQGLPGPPGPSGWDAPYDLVDAPVILTDAAVSSHFRVTLTNDRQLANPTNPSDGQRVIWEIKQDAVGGRTLTLDSKFTFGTDLVQVILSTQPNKRDYIGAVYSEEADSWSIIAFSRGYNG